MNRIGEAFAGLFRFDGGSVSFLLSHHDALYPLYLLVPACLGCLPVAGWLQKKLPEGAAVCLSAVFDLLLFFLCVALLLGDAYNPFIYFRF